MYNVIRPAQPAVASVGVAAPRLEFLYHTYMQEVNQELSLKMELHSIQKTSNTMKN